MSMHLQYIIVDLDWFGLLELLGRYVDNFWEAAKLPEENNNL